MSALQSIFDLEPLEFGGVENRKGIDFQDHVAASFCLAMLTDTRIESVWCERQDDVTVIRFENGQRTVEFIQVKGNSFDHLWSTAEICKRKEMEK
ncbi:MAG: DUF4297 domain-containing protein [Cytophagaceae bacterium]|nr:MAG: DUF4297 domain-containing protein [Cytophagaceae bacterium]